MKAKMDNKSEAGRNVTVYLASRNSSGIHERTLRVNGDDRVLGFANSRFLPWGKLSDVGTGADWRTAHCFFTYAEAKADYVALEKRRVDTARAALKSIAA